MNLEVEKNEFVKFDLSNWPLIVAKFDKLTNLNYFITFLQQWENLKMYGQKYVMVLDARNIKNVANYKCVMLASKFVKRLKKQKPQYLENSFLIYNTKIILHLFRIVKTVQKPISPTYLYYTKETGDLNYLDLFQNKDENENIKLFE